MKKDTLKRLQVLQREVLAQALFDLSKQSDDAKTVVERLTRTPDEAYKSTKRSIGALKRSSRYIQWSDIPAFVRKLENLVEDINKISISAEQRFNLICRFIETDQPTFDRVDDSAGFVGDVYRYSALSVFDECVAMVAKIDQAVVADELELLLTENDDGVRNMLVDAAVVHLDDTTVRDLIVRFSARSDQEPDSFLSIGWLEHVMKLAAQLGDTRLFEITALESVANLEDAEVPTHTKLKIASNYFKNNEFEKAKSWMDEIDASERFHQTQRNQLLVALHDKLGNPAERDRIALEQFKHAPSKDALETLLGTIGEHHRIAIVDEQVEAIFSESSFSDDSVEFLIDTGLIHKASEYTVLNHATINGDHYWRLPKVASHFSESGYPLAGICIYRALLNSILRRGNTKSYIYGARYLVILDELSETDFVEGMADHAMYKSGVQSSHGRKHSFWAKYDSER